MLVANHGSHVLSWDGAMVMTACLLETDRPRLVLGMAEHRLMELPFLGGVARRIGATDGRREPCAAILRAGGAVLTFPEGVEALRRPFREPYRLSPLATGSYVALATGAPVVPVAVIGRGGGPAGPAPVLAGEPPTDARGAARAHARGAARGQIPIISGRRCSSRGRRPRSPWRTEWPRSSQPCGASWTRASPAASCLLLGLGPPLEHLDAQDGRVIKGRRADACADF
jgi:hypothetical protein